MLAVVASLALAACSDSDNAGEQQNQETGAPLPGGDDATGEGTAPVEGDEEAPTADLAGGAFEEAPPPASGWNIDTALNTPPSCGASADGTPLRVGYAGLDAESAADTDIRLALEHFTEQVNCSGGLNGTPIELTQANIAGSAVNSRSELRNLLFDEAGEYKVDIVFGPPAHDPGLRVLIVTANEVPVIYLGATEPGLADLAELSYLASFNDTDSAEAAAHFASAQGWAQAVTLSADGPYYGYTTSVFAAAIQAGGGQVVADYEFDPAGGTDIAGIVGQISADPVAPDVIYTSMPADQAVQLKAQLASAGLPTALLLSDSFEKTGGYSQDSASIDGIYHVSHAFPAGNSRPVTLQQSMAQAGRQVSTYAYPAVAADAIAVVADALGRVTPGGEVPLGAQLGTEIARSTSVVGASGTLSYDGDPSPGKVIYIIQIQDNNPVLVHQYHQG